MNNKIIAFTNQKGGVGKTTSCVNVAASLHASGAKVLLVDLDPQGNATMGAGINKSRVSITSNEVLLQTSPIEKSLIESTPGGFDLLPANSSLTEAEMTLIGKRKREERLKVALDAVRSRYQFILIDCPPSLNMLTLNALVAADSLIIPMQCEYYALEGLSALIETMEQIKKKFNKKLHIEGVLRTMFDPRNRLSQDVSAQLKKYFSKTLYKTIIPRNIRLAEAPSHGVPVLLYDKNSRGAVAYLAVAGEILKASKVKVAKKRKVRCKSSDMVEA